jgi:hypothetical protein
VVLVVAQTDLRQILTILAVTQLRLLVFLGKQTLAVAVVALINMLEAVLAVLAL